MNKPKKQLSQSPWSLFWRHLRKNRFAMTGGAILVVFYSLALFADFFAPYGMETQNRSLFNCPPTGIHFFDSDGNFHIRPFVYGKEMIDKKWTKYEDDTSRRYPISLFVKGDKYKLLGMISSDRHLYGVNDEEGRVFLIGTDQLGRDVFSRLLFGGRISLSIGLVGILLSFSFGMLIGGISGYFGGAVDSVIMRFTELIMRKLKNVIPSTRGII